MATVVLGTAGQVIGTALGGPIGGAIGKAVGGYVGGRIDQKLFGPGVQRVEGPRLESLDVMTAQEGAPMPALDGRAAIAGQVIWATRLEEVASTETHGGGKGGGGGGQETEVTSYSYYASFAVAVCEGPVVISATKGPPASPTQGDAYILPPGQKFGDIGPGLIAAWNAGEWHGFNLPQGARWQVQDEKREYIRTATGWGPVSVSEVVSGGAAASGLRLEARDAVLNLTGRSVKAAGLIPARATVFGVTSWTISEVKGAPSYGVGLSGEATKFGGHLGAAVNSSNIGVVGPFATYSPTDVVVTATSGSFTAGKVGVQALLLIHPPAPV